MNTYVSLLRAINLGSYKRVGMKELEGIFGSLDSKNAKTYLRSGNVVFEHRSNDVDFLKEQIEKEIKRAFGFDVSVFIRKKSEFSSLVKNNPFAKLDENKLHVTFFSEEPSAIPLTRIDEARDRSEKFHFARREVYLFLPNGYGRTKLSNAFFEKKLGLTATTRNWKTVKNLLIISRDRSFNTGE